MKISGLRPRERERAATSDDSFFCSLSTIPLLFSHLFVCFPSLYLSFAPGLCLIHARDDSHSTISGMRKPSLSIHNSDPPSLFPCVCVCVCTRASPSSRTLPVSCAAVDAWGRRLCRIEDEDLWHTGKREILAFSAKFDISEDNWIFMDLGVDYGCLKFVRNTDRKA